MQASEGGSCGPAGGEADEDGNRSSPGVLTQSISFPDPKRAGEWQDALDSVTSGLSPHHQVKRDEERWRVEWENGSGMGWEGDEAEKCVP